MRTYNKTQDFKNRLKLAVVIAIAFSFVLVINECTGQDYDSLKERILRVEIVQRGIQMDFEKADERFDVGTQFIIGGVALSALDLFMLYKQRNNSEFVKKPRFLYFGMPIVMIGMAIQIDSHKFYRRASRK